MLSNLTWIEELLPTDVLQKSMHGGTGYYFDDRLILILVESVSSYEYKGVSYPFKIWNGCFFPIERIKQNAVFAKFPFLENHPASPNWLYLPADSEDFAEQVKLIVREIKKQNPLFGIPIKISTKKSNINSNDDEIDTSKPRLFRDVAASEKSVKKEKVVKPVAKPVKKVKANKKKGNDLLLSVLKRRSK